MKRFIFLHSLLLCLFLFGGTANAVELDLGKAENLLKEGKAKEAYALLAPHEFELAGDIKYDYLLGMAALDSGKPDKATLALERVLAVDPNFAGARLDLARAYFTMGDFTRARMEFDTILTQNPPAGVKLLVENHLAEIEKKQHPGPTLTGYMEATVGRDDNVNNSTNTSQVYIPLFGVTMTLSPTNVKTADTYWSFAGGGEINYPIDTGLSLYAGVDAKKRTNLHQDTFNNGSLDGRIGLSIGEGEDVFRIAANTGIFYLDDKFNRRSNGFSGEWRHLLNPRNQLSLFGQYTMLRYGHDKTGADQSSNDVNQTIGGAALLHALDEEGKSILFASLYAGVEKTTETSDRADKNQRFRGVKLGGQTPVYNNVDLFASAGIKWGDYDGLNPSYLTWRYDKLYDYSVGLSWRPAANWTVKPQLNYSNNASNLGINTYDRTDFSVTARYDFR